MRVIILADSNNTQPFEVPRQLYVINGERLIDRTVRQVKENKKRSIYITSHDERFDIAGTKRYEHDNTWKGEEENGIWLDAYPLDIIVDDTVILMGDVWYTDEAIKTILNYNGSDNRFFCTDIDKEKNPYYFKAHDEPLGWYIGNAEEFKTAVNELKEKQKDAEYVYSNWQVFRYLCGVNIDEHDLRAVEGQFTAINDGSIDIDKVQDIELLERRTMRYRVRCVKGYYDILQKRQVMPKEEFIVPYVRMLELIGNNRAKTVVCEMVEELDADSTEEAN